MDADIRSGWRLLRATNFEGVADEELLEIATLIPKIIRSRDEERIKGAGYSINNLVKLTKHAICEKSNCPIRANCANHTIMAYDTGFISQYDLESRHLQKNTPKLIQCEISENIYCFQEFIEGEIGQIINFANYRRSKFFKSSIPSECDPYEILTV